VVSVQGEFVGWVQGVECWDWGSRGLEVKDEPQIAALGFRITSDLPKLVGLGFQVKVFETVVRCSLLVQKRTHPAPHAQNLTDLT
jgi:hypothetical protein